ncbi:redoxin domain-containing protein [Candidatus Marsarchaeota archaeon]|nr:redoxin domain-containing protein [Candidatus Marsarchaeota archaeon]
MKIDKTKVFGIAVLAAVLIIVIIALLFMKYNSKKSINAVAQNITIGSLAPNYDFIIGNGSIVNLSAYRGHPVVLWFVATWCSSCAQGNEAINQNYRFFEQHGIKIIELELYKDLGYSGPPITGFIDSYAPSAYSNGVLIPALAGYNMTTAYDPKAYLDIYYLISKNGTVLYINGSPELTLGQLEKAINSTGN